MKYEQIAARVVEIQGYTLERNNLLDVKVASVGEAFAMVEKIKSNDAKIAELKAALEASVNGAGVEPEKPKRTPKNAIRKAILEQLKRCEPSRPGGEEKPRGMGQTVRPGEDREVPPRRGRATMTYPKRADSRLTVKSP